MKNVFVNVLAPSLTWSPMVYPPLVKFILIAAPAFLLPGFQPGSCDSVGSIVLRLNLFLSNITYVSKQPPFSLKATFRNVAFQNYDKNKKGPTNFRQTFRSRSPKFQFKITRKHKSSFA